MPVLKVRKEAKRREISNAPKRAGVRKTVMTRIWITSRHSKRRSDAKRDSHHSLGVCVLNFRSSSDDFGRLATATGEEGSVRWGKRQGKTGESGRRSSQWSRGRYEEMSQSERERTRGKQE